MGTTSRTGVAVTVAALVAGALAAGALAAPRLVPGHRIGPVAVGAERAVVETRIGPGIVIARTPSALAPGTRNLDRVVVAYPEWKVVATFSTDEASAQVTRIATRAARYRTRAGLGVGSTRAALLRALPGAVCGGAVCTVGRPGAALTRLRLAAGRIVRVAVLAPPPPA